MPTPIGNLEDLSFRAVDRLKNAEIFFCEDTRVTKSLISLIKSRFDVEFFPNAKFISFHSHNEDEIISSLDLDTFNKPAVFVSDAGMLAISDPGAKLVLWCQKNGVEYEVLSGANAALVAYAASGELGGKFVFYGFLPHKLEAKKEILSDLMELNFGVVLYESPKRVLDLMDLIATIDEKREIFAVKELTKRYEKRFFGSAKQVAASIKEANISGEWCVVIFPNRQTKADKNSEIVSDLMELNAPIKPLSKILSKLTDTKPSIWYERLLKAKK